MVLSLNPENKLAPSSASLSGTINDTSGTGTWDSGTFTIDRQDKNAVVPPLPPLALTGNYNIVFEGNAVWVNYNFGLAITQTGTSLSGTTIPFSLSSQGGNGCFTKDSLTPSTFTVTGNVNGNTATMTLTDQNGSTIDVTLNGPETSIKPRKPTTNSECLSRPFLMIWRIAVTS